MTKSVKLSLFNEGQGNTNEKSNDDNSRNNAKSSQNKGCC